MAVYNDVYADRYRQRQIGWIGIDRYELIIWGWIASDRFEQAGQVGYHAAYAYIWLTIVRCMLIGIDRYKQARQVLIGMNL